MHVRMPYLLIKEITYLHTYFRFWGAILNFRVKESPDEVGMGTVEKLTPKTWVEPLKFYL